MVTIFLMVAKLEVGLILETNYLFHTARSTGHFRVERVVCLLLIILIVYLISAAVVIVDIMLVM